ncbi:hypothetical protein AB0395_27465 [Streptosporangium sp. NPDC051023]|uniref:hypothetical protein n=1 Tax=Streptosporangium sp. NPDC051023 TaxID=3155410 RepID=UPI00344B4A10
MQDGRATVPSPAIPGWRLIISDRGRFWAFRQTRFPIAARRAGANSELDADTLAEIEAAVKRQEKIAEQVAS